jgi:hypothetical protein
MTSHIYTGKGDEKVTFAMTSFLASFSSTPLVFFELTLSDKLE